MNGRRLFLPALLPGALAWHLLFVAAPSTAEEASKAPSSSAAARSPLHAYVAKPDASYRWVQRREGTLLGVSYSELILTSQTWKDITWRHQLFVIKPPELKSSQCLLMISGGRW